MSRLRPRTRARLWIIWSSDACHANAPSMCNMQPQREIRRWALRTVHGEIVRHPSLRRGRNWPPRGSSRLIEPRPFFSFLPPLASFAEAATSLYAETRNRLWRRESCDKTGRFQLDSRDLKKSLPHSRLSRTVCIAYLPNHRFESSTPLLSHCFYQDDYDTIYLDSLKRCSKISFENRY